MVLGLVNICHIQVGKYQLCLVSLCCDYDEAGFVCSRVDQVRLKVKFHGEPKTYQACQVTLSEPAHLRLYNHDSDVDALKYVHRLVYDEVRLQSRPF